MEDKNPVSSWIPLNTPKNGETDSPVASWIPLGKTRDERSEKVVESYGYPERSTTNEGQKRFAHAVSEVVVSQYGSSQEIRILDVSANDLNVTLAFCKESSDSLRLKGKDPSKMKVWVNDMSYKGALGVDTKLAYHAEAAIKSGGSSAELIQHPLIGKAALEITSQDTGNQKLDVIWDRLGAMWHTLGERNISQVKQLLTQYRSLLKEGGTLILDGGAPGTGTGFDTDKRLQYLLADNNLDENWYAQIGFALTHVSIENQKLMILKRV